MGVHKMSHLKKIRKRMFKDLELVIIARNMVIEEEVKPEVAILVAKKIEDYSKHYAQAISVMNEQLNEAEKNGFNIEDSKFLYNYRALKNDTKEVLDVMFEMYTDVYNKLLESIREDD